MGADPESTANFAGKEKEKKEKEITSSVTGIGEKKPQIGCLLYTSDAADE